MLSRHLRRRVELLDLDAWPQRGVDVEPITLISAASIEHLASRLGLDALDHRRFRANLILAGAERPHQEDEWIGTEIGVGDAQLRVIGPIPRCAVITRDPDTGERDADTPVRSADTVELPRCRQRFGIRSCARVVSPGRVAGARFASGPADRRGSLSRLPRPRARRKIRSSSGTSTRRLGRLTTIPSCVVRASTTIASSSGEGFSSRCGT